MWIHLVARTRGAAQPFTEHGRAAWFWRHLRGTFPEALAAVLMPDHLHVITPAAARAKEQASNLLAAFGRRFELGRALWHPIPPPEPVRNSLHLWRQLRYVALNPCRDRLCSDPLDWLWSTYRDVMGATADPWVTAERLARAVGEPARDFRPRLHRYVSSDPSVQVSGTPEPVAAPPTEFSRYPLEWIAHAAGAALRRPAGEVKTRSPVRVLFLQLARAQGWRNGAHLARYSNVTRSGARKAASRSLPPQALSAAMLCLGDPRLRRKSSKCVQNPLKNHLPSALDPE